MHRILLSVAIGITALSVTAQDQGVGEKGLTPEQVGNMALVGEPGPIRHWPPGAREYLLKSLTEAVPKYLDSYHAETGKFGTEPWICTDQNLIFPLAAAWAIQDEKNPWFHSDKVLQAVAGGGDALVSETDKNGQWIFRKKDNSTWGQIYMPWTYSRWIRAYHLLGSALPPASKEKWEKGLLLGFTGIRRIMDGKPHNIPCHHAMGLYIAGECFKNQDWKNAAKGMMAKVIAEQNPVGYWSENFGPVVGYNAVYVDALGIYEFFSHDPAALDALTRAANFHAAILWPDGSPVSCIDERNVYHKGVNTGNVGFTWTPEGRGYLLRQMQRYSDGYKRLLNADTAATLLLYTGEEVSAESVPLLSDRDSGSVALGKNEALIRRHKPWQWAFSGYACKPPLSRWIQDRHNLVDVFHDDLGLVAGGGNTKLQPYWSTFTVGDPTLLTQTPGDENPNFSPKIDLLWTPDAATITEDGEATVMTLTYGDMECIVRAESAADGALVLTYKAPAGKRVEAHLPLLNRAMKFRTAAGKEYRLGQDRLTLSSAEIGAALVFGNLKVSVPDGASLLWPARMHNPYTKDGHSELSEAKLVLVLPFAQAGEYRIVLSKEVVQPFDGLAFEARDLTCKNSEGTYTKRLDDLGSQFLGGTKPGASLTFTLPAIEPGRYELLAEFVMAHSYGIVKVLLDGQPVGQPFDGYCEGVDADGERVSFGEVQVAAGEHTVAVEVTGQNPKATASLISVKRWLFRPVGK